jgi:hypothetical protein
VIARNAFSLPKWLLFRLLLGLICSYGLNQVTGGYIAVSNI